MNAILRMPGAVYLGEGLAFRLPEYLKGAKKIALFTDKGIRGTGLIDKVLASLAEAGIDCTVFDGLQPEPTVYQADEAIRAFRAAGAETIVAIGGGSVMDIAKLASVLDTDEYTVFDLLKDPAQAHKCVPTLMIPTTAGTGAEATPNAIVLVPEQALKVGIVNAAMIADTVILDPEVIRNLPRKIAAATGIDALAHAVECYTSNKATPFSNTVAGEAFRLIEKNIERACDDTVCDLEAKKNMLLASFYAGVAIAAAGTTGVHALSYPLGGKYHIAHGISNAILLMPVMHFNEPACRKELAALCDLVRPALFGGTDAEKADYILRRMDEIVRNVGIEPSLKPYGIKEEDLEPLVEAGMQVKRLLNNNKREITADDAREIYRAVL